MRYRAQRSVGLHHLFVVREWCLRCGVPLFCTSQMCDALGENWHHSLRERKQDLSCSRGRREEGIHRGRERYGVPPARRNLSAPLQQQPERAQGRHRPTHVEGRRGSLPRRRLAAVSAAEATSGRRRRRSAFICDRASSRNLPTQTCDDTMQASRQQMAKHMPNLHSCRIYWETDALLAGGTVYSRSTVFHWTPLSLKIAPGNLQHI